MADILFEDRVEVNGKKHQIAIVSEDNGGISFYVDGRQDMFVSRADIETLTNGGSIMLGGQSYSLPPETLEDWKRIREVMKVLDELEALVDSMRSARERAQQRTIDELVRHPTARA